MKLSDGDSSVSRCPLVKIPQLNPQLNSTQLNSTQLNSTQLNSTASSKSKSELIYDWRFTAN
jgi:hypothetical protein